MRRSERLGREIIILLEALIRALMIIHIAFNLHGAIDTVGRFFTRRATITRRIFVVAVARRLIHVIADMNEAGMVRFHPLTDALLVLRVFWRSKRNTVIFVGWCHFA